MKTKSTLLTKEERDILILADTHPYGKHLSNSEIGQRLGIPVSRVKNLIHQACLKLGAHSRNEAVLLALIRGDIRINELYSLDELAQILSSFSPDTLRTIAHLVRQEHGHIPGKKEQIILSDRRQNGRLTTRERDVLILVCRGLTNKEIADNLCISISAVRTFLNRASSKLGACRRDDAVVLALKQREISVGEILSLNEVVQGLAPLGAEAIDRIAQMLRQKPGQEPDLLPSPDPICPILGVQCSALAANTTACSPSHSR